MTQSLAQLQAEWRAMKDEGVSDFDSGVVAGFGGAANELQPHVEREAAARAKSLADERRIKELEKALTELANTADNYYCEAMHGSKFAPCLGWEAKAKCGEFGQTEYDAHKKIHELFGKHFGIHEAVKKMRAALRVETK